MGGFPFWVLNQEEMPVETWKMVKFVETASLEQLEAKHEQLEELIESGQVHGTNARTILAILKEGIALRKLFEED